MSAAADKARIYFTPHGYGIEFRRTSGPNIEDVWYRSGKTLAEALTELRKGFDPRGLERGRRR